MKPITPLALLADLDAAGCRPRLVDRKLGFDAHPPPALDAAVALLHTGLRAAIDPARPQWFGCREDGKPVPLSTAGTIPANVALLCCEGDAEWDRIHPAARLDVPAAFTQPRPARAA